jgi:hypothetical protein
MPDRPPQKEGKHRQGDEASVKTAGTQSYKTLLSEGRGGGELTNGLI